MAVCCCRDLNQNDWQVNGRRRAVCCTDIPCLVIFVIFWSAVVGMSSYAIVSGNPWRLLYGSDCYGNVCGSLNSRRIPVHDPELQMRSGLDMRGKPYLLYFLPTYPLLSRSVCVEKCPDEFIAADFAAFGQYWNKSGISWCEYGLNYTEVESRKYEAIFGATGRCPQLPIEPQRPLFRRCVPSQLYKAYRRRSMDAYSALNLRSDSDSSVDSSNNSTAALNERGPSVAALTESDSRSLKNIFGFYNVANSVFQQVLADVYTEWRDLLFICLAVLGASSLLLLTVLYWPHGFIVLCVAFGAIGSLALVAFLWLTFIAVNAALTAKHIARVPLLLTEIRNERVFLAFASVGSLLALALFATIIALRRRFYTVAHLFSEASSLFRALPVLLLQPFFSVLVLLFFMAGWLLVLAYVVTVDQPSIDTQMLQYMRSELNSTASSCIVYRDTPFSKLASALLVVALIWACEFVLAAQQFCVAYVVARWYFTREKPPGQLFAAAQYRPVANAVRMLIAHHVGTLALGSLVLPLCRFPRMLILGCARRLGYTPDRTTSPQQAEAAGSGCKPFCATTCSPFFWLSETCLKFINAGAYAVVATRGFALCEASHASYRLLAGNVQRVAAATSVSDFIMFLAKLGCATAAASVAVALLNSREIHFYALFVLVAAVYAFFIAHCFLSVYECAVDVLMLCYCEDCEVNDGTYGHEFYSSSKLMDVVKQTASRLNKLTKRHRDDKPILRTQQSEAGTSGILTDASIAGTGITTLVTPDCGAMSAGPFTQQQQVAAIAELSRMVAPDTPDVVMQPSTGPGQLVFDDTANVNTSPFALPSSTRI